MPTTLTPKTPISHNSFASCMDWLEGFGASRMRLGTERIERALEILGNPQNQFAAIHVVGTNGKGSTSAILASIYQAQGYKVGLFTSPHLVEVTERIQINGQPISHDDFVDCCNKVNQQLSPLLNDQPDNALSYFEWLTVIGFYYFGQSNLDIAIIEAGLGGRLDSTNVFEKPLGIVVTPIGLDHMAILGPDVTAITKEKVAVFKPNVPVFTSQNNAQALEVIHQQAKQVHTTVTQSNAQQWHLQHIKMDGDKAYREIIAPNDQCYQFGLLGHYQLHNAVLAIEVVKGLHQNKPVDSKAIEQGLKQVAWPARFQYFSQKQLIIDGSHNADGFKTLVQTVTADFNNPLPVIGLSLLQSKFLKALEELLTVNWPQYYLIETDSLTTSLAGAQKYWPENVLKQCIQKHQPNAQIQTIKLEAFLNLKDFRLLTGSLYTAGLAISELSD